MNYKAIIIDDETINLQLLQGLLAKYCPDLNIVATATNVNDGIEVILQHKPNILFLDIEIHGKTGFDILELIDDNAIQVILVTAFEKYTLKAFKYAVVDYLLKPIAIEELISAVSRCKARLLELQKQKDTIPPPDNEPEFIIVHQKDSIEIIKVIDIVHLDSSAGYTEIYTAQNRKILSSKSLSETEKLLPASKFFRVHNSHIVNFNHVLKLIRSKFGTLQMTNGSEIPISQTWRDEVHKRINLKTHTKD